ncbi:hypothetical protein LFM09_07680 [Lentzea alba]|uniref:hypothetical protein n=1 Tax=Lentzea alba TaxID=2714351 RepID=UPI0039BEE341
MWADTPGLVALAHSEVRGPAVGARFGPSVGYTDPAAGMVAGAVRTVLSDVGDLGDGEGVGVLTISATATSASLTALASDAGRGRLSPSRVAGAAPGSMAGLLCMVFGLRGPSLVITGAPGDVRPVAAVLARSWLAECCHVVLVCEHEAGREEHAVRVTAVERSC